MEKENLVVVIVAIVAMVGIVALVIGANRGTSMPTYTGASEFPSISATGAATACADGCTCYAPGASGYSTTACGKWRSTCGENIYGEYHCMICSSYNSGCAIY